MVSETVTQRSDYSNLGDQIVVTSKDGIVAIQRPDYKYLEIGLYLPRETRLQLSRDQIVAIQRPNCDHFIVACDINPNDHNIQLQIIYDI